MGDTGLTNKERHAVVAGLHMRYMEDAQAAMKGKRTRERKQLRLDVHFHRSEALAHWKASGFSGKPQALRMRSLW